MSLPASVLFLFLPPLASIALALYASSHRRARGAESLAALMLASAWWGAGYALEILAGADLGPKVFWAGLKYLGIVIVPLAWLAFALEYTHRQAWLTRRRLVYLLVEPVFVVALALTNGAHQLLWTRPRVVAAGPFEALAVDFQPLFWLHTAYSFALLLAGTLFVLQSLLRAQHLGRGQSAALLAAVAIPWVSNVVSILSLSPIPNFDLTPSAFAVMGLALGWGIFRYQLLNLAPIAREAVIENMSDGTLVLDAQARIVDINPAAQRIFGVAPAAVLGRPLDEALKDWPALGAGDDHVDGYPRTIAVRRDGAQRDYEVRTSELPDRRGRAIGRLVLLHDVTERRRAEEEREKLVSLIEYSTDFIGMASLSGEMLYLNQAGVRLAGLDSADQARQRAMYDFLAADDLPRFRAEILPAVMEEGYWDGEFRLKHFQTGEAIPVQFSIFLVRHPRTAEPMAFASVTRDITERKQAEAALAQYADEMVTLYRASQEIGASLDPEQVYQAAHLAASRLIPGEVFIISLLDEQRQDIEFVYSLDQGTRLPPRRVPAHAGLSGRVIDTGQTVRVDDLGQAVDLPVIHLGGDRRVSSILAVPLQVGPKRLGMLSIQGYTPYAYTDQHEQLLSTLASQVSRAIENARLYQAVSSAHSRLQALITSSRDGVLLVGTDWRILVVNAATLQLLRLSGEPEDWLGHPLEEWLRTMRRYAPEAVKSVLAEKRRILGGDETPAEGEFEVPPRHVRWLNLPVKAGAASVGRLVVLADVTEERQVEAMREDLTHTMVHDLRNPLGSIHVSLEMLMAEGAETLDAEQQELVGLAQESSRRMLALVNAILDVSRLESGQMPLQQKAADLAGLVAEAVQFQAPLANKKNLRLEKDVPYTLPLVWVDAGLVGRVLQNLIGNAVKFTPEGGVIRVTAGVSPADETRLQIAVQDSGPGISPDLLGRLFGKFVTGQQMGRGSGLGLAFARLAVEAHGGRIWVESKAGRGATFFFTLPAAK